MRSPKVNDRSWHYRFWSSTYWILGMSTPRRFSICPYFWRVVLWGPLIMIFLGPICLTIRGLVGLGQLIGRRLSEAAHSEKDPVKAGGRQARHDRLMNKTGRVLGVVIRVAIVTFFIGAFTLLLGIMAFVMMQDPARFLKEILYLLVLMAFIFAFALALLSLVLSVKWVKRAIVRFFQSDTGKTLGEYLKAQKERICPFVEVIRT